MLRASWYKYLSLLDIDFGAGFRYPKCFAQPDIVICDATSLAFRRNMLKSHKPFEDVDKVLDGRYSVCAQLSYNYCCWVFFFGFFKDRVFIEEAECRRLLRRYSETAEDNDSLHYFNEADAKKLLDCLQKYSPTLVPLIKSWGSIVPCDSRYAPLLKALSSSSPLCALIHPSPDVLDLVENIANGYEVRCDPELWHKLQMSVPLLYQLLSVLNCTSIPSVLSPILLEMNRIAVQCFKNTTPEQHVDVFDECNPCCYYPNLPIIRKRGVYKSDSVRKDQACTKVHRGHLPGIFTLFCSHGI